MKTIITITAVLLLMGCNGITTAKQMSSTIIEQATLPEHLTVGKNLLSRDTINQAEYPVLTDEERSALVQQTELEVPEDIQIIGVRELDKKHTLAAYRIPIDNDSLRFKVYLVTRDIEGTVIDVIDLNVFHTCEHQRPMTFGGNRFYTTDTDLLFDGTHHFTVHHVMTLTGVYLKDHSLTEMWRVEWNDNYEITEDGHFNFMGQQETYRTDCVDDPKIEEYKSRDRSE